MKKVGLLFREKVIEQIEHQWAGAKGCVFVGFDKISAFAFNGLRNNLRREKSYMLVSKNLLAQRALGEQGLKDLSGFFSGATGLIFIDGESVINVAKLIVDFSKEHEGFKLRGAYLGDKRLTAEDLERISRLPSREIVLAQAVMTIASPLTGFVGVLNNITVKFLWLIEEIKKKKSGT